MQHKPSRLFDRHSFYDCLDGQRSGRHDVEVDRFVALDVDVLPVLSWLEWLQ